MRVERKTWPCKFHWVCDVHCKLWELGELAIHSSQLLWRICWFGLVFFPGVGCYWILGRPYETSAHFGVFLFKVEQTHYPLVY